MALPPVGLPPLTMAAVCAVQPPTKAIVIAVTDPLAIGLQFDFAQLRTLAEKSHRIGNHPPYGFYYGAVTYAVTVNIGNHDRDLCEGPVDIAVTLRLTDRRIEVARDLKDDPCRFTKIMAHYRHHADADEAVFQHYVLKITATLARFPVSAFAETFSSGDIARNIRTIIEPDLRSMDAERDSVRQEVDTPAEVRELEGACTEKS